MEGQLEGGLLKTIQRQFKDNSFRNVNIDMVSKLLAKSLKVRSAIRYDIPTFSYGKWRKMEQCLSVLHQCIRTYSTVFCGRVGN